VLRSNGMPSAALHALQYAAEFEPTSPNAHAAITIELVGSNTSKAIEHFLRAVLPLLNARVDQISNLVDAGKLPNRSVCGSGIIAAAATDLRPPPHVPKQSTTPAHSLIPLRAAAAAAAAVAAWPAPLSTLAEIKHSAVWPAAVIGSKLLERGAAAEALLCFDAAAALDAALPSVPLPAAVMRAAHKLAADVLAREQRTWPGEERRRRAGGNEGCKVGGWE
jgi:hypothetical protein